MSFRVSGSEEFNGRPVDFEELRTYATRYVKLHSAPKELIDSVDPVTYEVVRHRLWSITGEMGEALKRMSGSVVVTDANDFNFAITDEVGQSVQIGPYNLQLAASVDLAITWSLRHRSENPGIREGDMFICNDPWVGGGLHQNDVCLFAPIFWDGKLFAWSAATAHQVDLGGVAPGSWTPRSQDVFWESLPIPPLKIVQDSKILRDVEDAYTRRSRVPKLVALDLRAMVGGNRIASDRMHELIRRYGDGTVKAVIERIMLDAEKRLRRKLAALPDGTWKATTYQEQAFEGDRGLYKIAVAMTKKGESLTFDFRGTDKQAGMINCTFSGMRAGILSPLLTIMCGDIPWAPGGLMRCFEIVSEEGTLNNASFPAGICKASVSSAWATEDAVTECLSKMLDTGTDQRKSGIAVSCGTWLLSVLAGTNQYDTDFVTMLMEPMASGRGARFNRDGVDTGGSAAIPMGRAPDAEMTEFMFPVLLLWRREESDSGGPGVFRGGLTSSVCLVPHRTSGPLQLVCSGSGRAVPMNVGLAGGYPGNTEVALAVRQSDVKKRIAAGDIPSRLTEISGVGEYLQDETETALAPEDAYYMCWQSGGGYGDPILRPSGLIEQDVGEFKVTVEAAKTVYGVIVDPITRQVDREATQLRRNQIREQRRSRSIPAPLQARAAGEQLESAGAGSDFNLLAKEHQGELHLACSHCGHIICRKDEDFLSHLRVFEGSPSEAGPQVWPEPSTYIDARVVFRQYYCPGCYVALLTQVVPA